MTIRKLIYREAQLLGLAYCDNIKPKYGYKILDISAPQAALLTSIFMVFLWKQYAKTSECGSIIRMFWYRSVCFYEVLCELFW